MPRTRQNRPPSCPPPPASFPPLSSPPPNLGGSTLTPQPRRISSLRPPYKSLLLPLWRFSTPSIARTSAQQIWDLFESFCKREDFVGADNARKFLQMGMTRAGRYANHKGGRKYAKVNGKKGEGGKEKKVLLEQVEGDWEGRQEKREASTVFRGYWERAKAHPEYVRLKEEFLKGQREQEEPKLADEGRDGKSTGHGERGRKRKR